jgi:hypothetical protein
MDLMRIQRLGRRFLSRTKSHKELRQIGSRGEILAWSQARRLDFLNGSALRAKLVQGLVEKGRCGVFIETGTSHAATAIGVRGFLGIPVWSCEINRKDYLISRCVTVGMSHISLYNLDSREFLKQAVGRVKAENLTPFIYLDAHEGELDLTSLPLADEIRIIMDLDSFVVMIDDFRVPSTDGFRWGTYGGVAIDLPLIENHLKAGGITSCYFPGYPPPSDGGSQSGYCAFWRNQALDREVGRETFPFDLLRAYTVAR